MNVLGVMAVRFIAFILISFLSVPVFGGELHDAAQQGDVEQVRGLLEEVLLESEASNQDRTWGDTLKSYIGYNSEPGEQVNAVDDEGRTALFIAASRGHTEIVRLLLRDEGIDVNAVQLEPFLPQGPPPYRVPWRKRISIEGDEDYYWAARHANYGIREHVEATTLHVAASEGHTDIVRLLLADKDINVHVGDASDYTALHMAAWNGHTEIVRMLVKKGGIDLVNAISGRPSHTALQLAARRGHSDVVKLLVKEGGIDVNAKDETDLTALHWASWNGHAEIVELLLNVDSIDVINDRGDVGRVDDNGKTALFMAAWRGHADVVEKLLEPDVDVNAKEGTWGSTALHGAVSKGHKEVVLLLLEKADDIDVNATSYYGFTALHRAVHKGHREIVWLLLQEKDIDVNAKDYSGKTALDLAIAKGDIGIVELFPSVAGVTR